MFKVILLFFTSVLLEAGPIENLQAGQWAELPCVNKIRDVLPSPVPPGNGPGSIITAWNSGAYDIKRDRYIIWGGGHNDYAGNEIYTFDIATLTWTRVWGPTPNSSITTCTDAYADGNPNVVHTYDQLEYLAGADRFFKSGGYVYCGGGWGTLSTWTFDFNSLTWAKKASHPNESTQLSSAYDALTGHVFFAGPGNSNSGFYEYNPVSNAWTLRNNNVYGAGYNNTGTLDPKRRKFFGVGGGTMREFDLPAAGTCAGRVLTTSGPSTIVSAGCPGVDYDPVSENLIGWSGGTAIYSYDPDTKAWTAHSTSGANPGAAVSQGTFSRWRYVPSKNVFIIINSIDANVFAYRHTSAASAPQWYLDLLAGKGTAAEMTLTSNHSSLQVFPNPCRGWAQFKLLGGPLPGGRIEICDLRGRAVTALHQDKGGALKWDTRAIPDGVYLASVTVKGKKIQKTFLVVH